MSRARTLRAATPTFRNRVGIMRPRVTLAQATAVLAGFLALSAPGIAQAQDAASRLQAARDRFELSLAFVTFGTGARVNCPHGAGLAAGMQVQSLGPWLVAGGLEVAYASAFVCTASLPLATYQDQIVEEWAGFRFGPRASLRTGRAISVKPSLILEPSVGAGAIYGVADFFPDDEWSIQPWFTGSVALRADALPVDLRIEYGRMAIPIRYQQGRDVIHEFRRWEHLFTLAVML